MEFVVVVAVIIILIILMKLSVRVDKYTKEMLQERDKTS